MVANSYQDLTLVEFDRWMERDVRDFLIELVETDLPAEVAKGFDNQPTVVTDGVTRRDPRAVRPYGRIEFLARVGVREPVEFALRLLRRLSPRGPAEGGHYADAHVVLLNGAGLSSDGLEVLDRVKQGDRVQIVNIMPYARKIEGARAARRKGVRWSGRRGLSRQAPGGVYRKVHGEITRRWGRTVAVDYRLEQLSLDGVQGQASGARAWRSKGGYYTYPVLNFFVKGAF